MNSILDTQPKYCETVASKNGWVDPNTNELIVSVKGLYDKIMQELAEVQAQMAIMEANGEHLK